jgi:HK97 family phage major capsid protein
MPKLNQLGTDIASYTARVEKRMGDLQRQVDAIDSQTKSGYAGPGEGGFDLKGELDKNDSLAQLLRDQRGKALLTFTGASAQHILERKTTITSGSGGTVGAASSGVLQIDRLPGITTEARQQLTVRQVLTARPTTFQLVDFLKVNAPMTIASPQVEAATKAENAVTFNTASERVKTIATWIPASKQVISDMVELMGFLDSTLGYYVDLAEEQQLLSGDGTGENLHGLITQATAFNTGLLSAVRGWNKIDIIGRIIQQITAAKELPPTFVVMNPNDWWDIRLSKDGFGRYILGDPQSSYASMAFGSLKPVQALFDLQVVATTNIASGTFLVGSGSPIASEIRDRMELVVEVSTEFSDYFVRNLVAIRAEKRLALLVKRPASYVSGTFTTSPA